MKINDIPQKYKKIWLECVPLLRQGRPDGYEHAQATVKFISEYKGGLKMNKDILVPVAIMHDMGHAYILPEHFKYITGPKKFINGKLVHMLVGAKIARDILRKVGYNKNKTKEIVDIISMHDFDQLEQANVDGIYSTENKRIFHDIDLFDLYNEKRIKNISSIYKNRKKLLKVLKNSLGNFFHVELRKLAEGNLYKMMNRK